MKSLKKIFASTARRVIDTVIGNGLMQEENTACGDKYITPGMPEITRSCAEEGIVLLKNDNGVLPLDVEDKVAVFGRCQLDWFYVGYGSGGDVHSPYKVSFMEGCANAGIQYDEKLAHTYDEWCNSPEHVADHGWWGHWPYFHPEMPLAAKEVEEAAKRNDKAIVIIGRAAGEDRDNHLQEGSYYLTTEEHNMLKLVCQFFEKTIVIMNCGNIIDMSWTEQYDISAIVYAWQLGQESGNAVANILSGKVSPSGKMTDTIARQYTDYPSANNFGDKEATDYEEGIFVGYRYFSVHPEKVLYPFGYGMSYTTFDITVDDYIHTDGCSKFSIQVKNTGNYTGKEVVQIYATQPDGKLKKAKKILVAYKKTKELAIGEGETMEFAIADSELASYDDTGVTGYQDAFVLEKGKYQLIVGNSVMGDLTAGTFELSENVLVEQCHRACVEQDNGSDFMRERILENLPEEISVTGNKALLLSDVKAGKCSMEAFIAQLSDKELSDLTHGEGGMGSSLGTAGNAGVFGGITEELREKGIPVITTADGPAGIRLQKYTTLLPSGTAIACTWNDELVEKMFCKVGEECQYYNVDVLLSPGMNIHRNPLCGRNFEYYSEDPLVSGKIAAAAVRGIQSGGVSACPKHFACNNQEQSRNRNNSRVSQRALREIYLKNFEICIKEGKPHNLMTSYNKLNGVWCHYHYDLVTTILRGEWKYKGNVITDWWMQMATSPEFPLIKNNAYRVRAQVDVLMPGNKFYTNKKYTFDKEQLSSLGKEKGLTRAELQRCARNVLEFALKII